MLAGDTARLIRRPCVSTAACRFLPLIFLPASYPEGSMRAPFFGAFDALAVDNGGGRRWVPAHQRAHLRMECVVQPRERAVRLPLDEVAMDRRLGRKILGQLPPLATRREHVQDAVEDTAPVCGGVPSPDTRRWQIRLDQCPFLVGHIGRITLPLTLVLRPVFDRPHASPLRISSPGATESQQIHRAQHFSGRTLRKSRCWKIYPLMRCCIEIFSKKP